jgi:transposase
MVVKDHLPLSELRRLERVEKDADRAKRLRIIILGMEGWTAPAVAMAVGLTRRICQRWVRRYNEQGLAGLEDRRGREPRLPLTPEQQEQVRKRLDAGPAAADEVCSLRGKDVQRILAQEFNLLRSLAPRVSPAPSTRLLVLAPSAATSQGRSREASGVSARLAPAHASDRRSASGQAAADLLSGRIAVWPAGDDHERLGEEGLATDGRSTD